VSDEKPHGRVESDNSRGTLDSIRPIRSLPFRTGRLFTGYSAGVSVNHSNDVLSVGLDLDN
jgi:hypothetical protein